MMRRLAPHATAVGTLALSLGCIVRGAAWLPYIEGRSGPNQQSGPPTILGTVFPNWAWGTAWLTIGLVLLVSAVRRRYIVALNAGGGMCVLWGILYLLGWCFPPDGANTGADWISASTYLSFGIYILATTHLASVRLEARE